MYEFKGAGLQLFTENQLESIHVATVRVLEEVGVRVYGKEALEIFHGAGCLIDPATSTVKIPQHVVEDAIRSSPSKVLLAARDPRHDIEYGVGGAQFSPFGVGVSVLDPRTGKVRTSTLKDVADIARVSDALEEVSSCGAVVVAHDVPEAVRPLYDAEAVMSNTSKHVGGGGETAYALSRFIQMGAALAGGMDKLRERPLISSGTCPHSPLTLHKDNTEMILVGARAGIPMGVLTMAMAGGTAPVTLAGALVVTNAEVLSGITLVQLVRRGNPVTIGSSTTMLDLLHTTAATGAPEHALISAGVAQLGRYYKIPTVVGGNWADSKISDAQVGHEKTLTALLPALAGASDVYGMGVLEAGMTFSFAQLLMDAEYVRMINRTLQGIAVNDETLAVDVIKAVGAGKNYLTQKHTLQLMGREQSKARLIDRRMRDAWLRRGGKDMAARANEEALDLLENYKPLPLDPGVQAKLREIVETSAEECGDRV